MKRVIDGCHAVALGIVNAFLLETPEGLVLVDAGFPGREGDVLAAMQRLGYEPTALKHIVLTHAHPDHVGSAAALVRLTGAQTWMHGEDAPVAENRVPMRPIHPFPGVLPKLIFAAISRMGPPTWDTVTIDHPVADGDVLPFGPLRVIHVPSHCTGQIALLWAPGPPRRSRRLREPAVATAPGHRRGCTARRSEPRAAGARTVRRGGVRAWGRDRVQRRSSLPTSFCGGLATEAGWIASLTGTGHQLLANVSDDAWFSTL